MIKIGPSGINKILPFKYKPYHFLIQFVSGQIAIFDFKKNKVIFESEIAHTS